MAEKALIQSIAFDDEGGFVIQFVEQRKITPKGTTAENHYTPPGVVPDNLVQEIVEAIRDLLDLALEEMRDDPPMRLSRR